MALVDFTSFHEILKALYNPAQVPAMRPPKGSRPKPNDASWPHRRWLDWFLRNHTPEPLVAAGLWKKSKFILDDFEGDENVAAIRAAYALDGEDGAWAVLVDMLLMKAPPGFEPPLLPEGWESRLRYYAEQHRGPGAPPLYGKWLSDRKER